jgi:hypothetical protein
MKSEENGKIKNYLKWFGIESNKWEEKAFWKIGFCRSTLENCPLFESFEILSHNPIRPQIQQTIEIKSEKFGINSLVVFCARILF